MKRPALLLFFSLLLLAACSSPNSSAPTVSSIPTAPQVIINSPASGVQFPASTDVAIQSTSSDAAGVLRVELLVDGQSVRSDAIPTGKSQPQFQVAQTWKATTPGTHIVIVRATNEKGVTGEASLVITVTDPPKPTIASGATSSSSAPASAAATAKPPAATAAPALSAQSVAPTQPPAAPTQVPVAPTAKPAPTNPPATNQYTLILTEAQVNALINSALTASQVNAVSAAGVSLQNGQISAAITAKGPGGVTVNGKAVIAVSASNCDLHCTILEASAGPVSLTEAQKVALNQAMERAIASQLAQNHSYTCVDSITIANAVMVIKYH